MLNKENIAIIDADTIIYIATYNKKGDPIKKADEVLDACNNVFVNMMNDTKCNLYCGFLTEGKSFRSKIGLTKEYKGNRKDFVKPKFYNLAKAYLYDYFYFKSQYNYEADDLCIMSYHSLKEEYNPIICSPDKDLKQVEGTFYDYKKRELSSVSKIQAEYNFWYQTLVGDVIDNISGCKGVGKVKAKLLLNNVQNPWALRTIVFDQYIKEYGEYEGIIKFTENYRLCKMLDKTLEGEIYKPELFKYVRDVDEGEEW